MAELNRKINNDTGDKFKYGVVIFHPEYISNHNFSFDTYIFEPLKEYPYCNKIRVIVITDIILKDEYANNYFYEYKLIKEFCEYFEKKFDGNIIICHHLLSSNFIKKDIWDRSKKQTDSMYSSFTLSEMAFYKANFYVYNLITRCGEAICIYNNDTYNKVYNYYRIQILSKYLTAEERNNSNGLLNPNQI